MGVGGASLDQTGCWSNISMAMMDGSTDAQPLLSCSSEGTDVHQVPGGCPLSSDECSPPTGPQTSVRSLI